MNNDQKIFCVGFQKTGTTSFNQACTALGFRCQSAWMLVQDLTFEESNVREIIMGRIRDKMEKNDVLEDAPSNFFFKELDEEYPNAKFVLTIREENLWFKSAKNFFVNMSPARKWMYGVTSYDDHEEEIRRVYRTHNQSIIEHFQGRPEKLLIMDLSDGDGWLELVTFLGKEYLPKFPHVNKAASRQKPSGGSANHKFQLLRKLKNKMKAM